MHNSTLRIAAASLTALIAGGANADIINIFGDTANSTEGIADFAGTLNYASTGATTGSLLVTLTNTTSANAAKITGFAFDIGTTGAGRTAALVFASHPFLELFNVSASPFGTYDSGAALGGSWNGGGSPNAGILIGVTGTFRFNINAFDAGSLSAADFLTGGDNEFGFVVRVRGISPGDASDKVPAMIPTSGAFALIPLTLVAFRRRR